MARNQRSGESVYLTANKEGSQFASPELDVHCPDQFESNLGTSQTLDSEIVLPRDNDVVRIGGTMLDPHVGGHVTSVAWICLGFFFVLIPSRMYAFFLSGNKMKVRLSSSS